MARGLSRTLWPWLAGAGAVVVLIGVLLWGANRPDDPDLGAPAGDRDGRTEATPADGLEYEEVHRAVGDDCLLLLIADSPAERNSGLRYRESELDRVDGMLFVGDAPSEGGFTMAGVIEPLQLAFYDADGNPVGGHDMEPCSGTVPECPRHEPEEPWSFALETAPGELPPGPLGGRCDPAASALPTVTPSR